jgi:hypothetical protein
MSAGIQPVKMDSDIASSLRSTGGAATVDKQRTTILFFYLIVFKRMAKWDRCNEKITPPPAAGQRRDSSVPPSTSIHI